VPGMPRIEMSRTDLLGLAGIPQESEDGLAALLASLKAEKAGAEGDILKIELKDTNRPDLWCVEGIARGIRCLLGGREDHLSRLPAPSAAVEVDPAVREVRPWIAAFAARGPSLSPMVLDALIASQEKLASSFGRNRKSAAIGFYRLGDIRFPVRYSAVPPDTVFHPLGEPGEMPLHEVLDRTEAGRKYAGLLAGKRLWPFLSDAGGAPLSFPPVLNSEDTGRLQPGDCEIFCEVTGTDWSTVHLTSVILACNLEDRGFGIEPVEIRYPAGSPGGERVATPAAFSDRLEAGFDLIERITGSPPDPASIPGALSRMDYASWSVGPASVDAVLAPYRHDGMHPVDLVEDLAIAAGFSSFEPLLPAEYTLGASAPEEDRLDAIRAILVGLGCEELLLPVLQARESAGSAPPGPIPILNPMTAEYSAVRNSLVPGLLRAEAASAHAAYPHRLFEAGEVLGAEGGSLLTRMTVAVCVFGNDAQFGDAHAILGVLAGYRGVELALQPHPDERFIAGRCASVRLGGRLCGVIGELHPGLLDSMGISRPGSAFEVDAEGL